jgi:hypothetical protein
MEENSVDKLSVEYIELRTQREKLKVDYEADDKKLEAKMQTIETTLLDIMRDTGTETMSTPNATVMRRVSNRYSPTNWDAVYKLVERHHAFGLLQKRIHDTNMKQFLEEHPDEYPAGLNVDSRYAVTIRRKTSI